ncbi:MAG: cupin domain-containing protein [Actinobacteria bacterium]|nr:cupin domain-containing protein [Actinomycetota bacterium]
MAVGASVQHEIDQLYLDLETSDLQPLWTQGPALQPFQPAPRTKAWMWEWETLVALAQRAGKLITIDRGGDRRVLSMVNPGLGGLPFITPTLWGAIQYLNGHEQAPGHRHTAGAVRFVLQGEGTWTTVNGDAIDMSPGDLILTPSWHWHDHTNESDDAMVWFDGLDLPLVYMLEAGFFEPYPVEELQPVRGHNLSEKLYGNGTAPIGPEERDVTAPLLVYRYTHSDRRLSALVEMGGGPLVGIEFLNPLTGSNAIPTFSNEMYRLVPGSRTMPVRKVGNSVFLVFKGSGTSIVDGKRFDWRQGDVFVAPSWAAVEHEASEQADLFVISDRPIMQALGIFRSETLDDHQEEVSTFSGHDS